MIQDLSISVYESFIFWHISNAQDYRILQVPIEKTVHIIIFVQVFCYAYALNMDTSDKYVTRT